ncbi:MAG: M12 family metallopeptidase [Tepidiformaceae bacterium]
MAEPERICFDRILPHDLNRELSPTDGDTRAALPFRKRWPVGSTLRVRFMEGTEEQQATVMRYAPQWFEHANLSLSFGNAPDSEIRITFRDDGAWSYMGTDCATIPRNQATMNFGWLDEGVVLHEFGHALGLIHEHQNPVGGIKWNKPVVYRALGGSPNFWDTATIDHNMFKTYDRNQLNGTALDPKSIMLYSFPASWTLDGFAAASNDVLSQTDKAFIGGTGGYPGRPSPEPGLPVIAVNGPAVEGSIGEPGEEDLHTFMATEAGEYTVETSGRTDVVTKLFGPEVQTLLLAEDDDSGEGLNSRIAARLEAGRYFVQIRHYSARRSGSYSVRVTLEGRG